MSVYAIRSFLLNDVNTVFREAFSSMDFIA